MFTINTRFYVISANIFNKTDKEGNQYEQFVCNGFINCLDKDNRPYRRFVSFRDYPSKDNSLCDDIMTPYTTINKHTDILSFDSVLVSVKTGDYCCVSANNFDVLKGVINE